MLAQVFLFRYEEWSTPIAGKGSNLHYSSINNALIFLNMRSLLFTLALICACAFSPIILSATTIIPYPNLGEAAKYSECIVLARAINTVLTDQNGTIYKETRFEVIASIKGALWPDTVIHTRPLSFSMGGFNVDIAGDFKPEIDKIYLLFLYKHGECWRPIMLSYYVFEQFQIGATEYLVPVGGEGMEVENRPDGQPVEPMGVFQQDVFLQNLTAFLSSPNAIWTGSMGRTSLQGQDFMASDRAIPAGCDFKSGGSNNARWQNAAVPIYYDDTSVPANWSSVFTSTLSALNSNYSGIDPTDAGSTSYVPNCGNNSAYQGNFLSFADNNLGGAQSMLIMFGDPCNEIPNLNNCSGTLAFGGSYSSGTHVFDGTNWQKASYGFLVVNNGAPECLSPTNFERLMSHELTHSYRMGHLDPVTYPNQNMNPSCCNAINTKDRECMNYAYPGLLPVSLLSFNARLQNDQQVKLTWATESEKDNAYFSILRSANGVDYEQVQRIPSTGSNTGGNYDWVDTRPLAGINYYLLSQTDFDGTVQNLSVKAVTLGKSAPVLSINSNPVKGDILSYSIEMPTGFSGNLDILDIDGRVLSSSPILMDEGSRFMQQPLVKLYPGVYLLRLYNGQEQWTARFLKQ